jgi:hypothetical protein
VKRSHVQTRFRSVEGPGICHTTPCIPRGEKKKKDPKERNSGKGQGVEKAREMSRMKRGEGCT